MSIILAIDLGTKKVGLAVSDEDQIIAKALPLFHTKSQEITLEKIKEIVKQLQIGQIVIGNPVGYEGEETSMSKKVREFTALLGGMLPDVKITLVNESMTSVMARQTSKLIRSKKKNIDGEAARIMLQEYLDFNGDKVQ